MPTFLEYLWSTLYAQDCERRFAALSSAGIEIADMSAAQIDDLAAKSQAFADAMVTATTPASLATLQANIAALKAA